MIGPDGKVLEVQIRTNAMHEYFLFVLFFHWKYKGTDAKVGSDYY